MNEIWMQICVTCFDHWIIPRLPFVSFHSFHHFILLTRGKVCPASGWSRFWVIAVKGSHWACSERQRWRVYRCVVLPVSPAVPGEPAALQCSMGIECIHSSLEYLFRKQMFSLRAIPWALCPLLFSRTHTHTHKHTSVCGPAEALRGSNPPQQH